MTPSLFAITGSSGAGVQPQATTHHPMRAHNVFAYSVLGHRHEAEVLQAWREWVGRPDADRPAHDALGPVRARASTSRCTPSCRRSWPSAAASPGTAAAGWFREAYAGRPFVRVLDAPPELTHAVGTNYALIHAVESDERRGDPGDAWRSTTW